MPPSFLGGFSFPWIPVMEGLNVAFEQGCDFLLGPSLWSLLTLGSGLVWAAAIRKEEAKPMTCTSLLNKKNNGPDSKAPVVNGKAPTVFDGLQTGPI